MAVSKRLRFEVLRRDNHTCRYCGGTAPDVVLTVDHVVPKTLGGADEPSNLVAACKDCNAGKSSSPPNAATVQTVSDDAARWAAAIRQAAEENQLHDNTEVYAAVVDALASFRRNQIPKDYRETVDQFLNAGLPASDIVQMAHVADAKYGVYDRWAYFCGCCWTRVRKLQELAQEIVSGQPVGTGTTPSIETVWTVWDIDLQVRHASDIASGVVVAASIHCQHRDSDDDPCCEDPVCRAVWATEVALFTEQIEVRNFVRDRRDSAIMDELDRLEMADG